MSIYCNLMFVHVSISQRPPLTASQEEAFLAKNKSASLSEFEAVSDDTEDTVSHLPSAAS